MNYLKIYNQIINKAKNEIREGYLEKHHILPKCMGGTNEKENLVQLTAREHYICHWLLARHYKTPALLSAFAMMHIGTEKHQRNSRNFERARIARRFANLGSNNPMFGKPSACIRHTEETKEKIRQSKLGKKRKPFKRRSPSEETRKKLSLSIKKKYEQDPTYAARVSNSKKKIKENNHESENKDM